MFLFINCIFLSCSCFAEDQESDNDESTDITAELTFPEYPDDVGHDYEEAKPELF